jgi:hypothetical protein
MRYTTSLAIALCVAACTSNPPPSTGGDIAWRDASAQLSQFQALPDQPPLEGTLGLAADQLSDSALARLLTQHLILPSRVSVAILLVSPATTTRFGRYYPSWSNPSVTLDITQQLADSTAHVLQHSPRVGRALALPSFLAGSQPSVASLREAAARSQADIMFLYRPTCRVYERAPIFRTVQYRSTCTVEAVLLDTRTGLVPSRSVTTRDNYTQRQRDDHNADATVARSQFTAILDALTVAATDAAAFLATVPTTSP